MNERASVDKVGGRREGRGALEIEVPMRGRGQRAEAVASAMVLAGPGLHTQLPPRWLQVRVRERGFGSYCPLHHGISLRDPQRLGAPNSWEATCPL